ncbi:MAG TPA: Cys-Gln thioester bond-forming surface protein, partial [Candidatus Merdibacter merdigallinarum]|nr:Cys-Gln thioester bond-forming surface protein [Candidatus Merdibacter merdigallinarum]
GFCVEPEQFVNSGNSYTKDDLTWNQKLMLERIAYVGWVLSDQTDNDYATTQFMIWEALGSTINSHSLSGYETKKQEIRNKVNKLFGTFPSFRNQTVELDVGESITLTDTNGVFQYYNQGSKSSGINVKKSGNKLTITATKDASADASVSYQLVKKDYVGTSLLYSSDTEQDVAVFKHQDPRNIKINIKVNKYGSLKIAKQDEDGTSIPNTSFKVSAHADMSDPIGTYTTGSDGTVTVNDLAPATYYVQEVSVPSHLVLDSTIRSVTVQANQTATFTARNNWKKGKVLIRKTDQDSGKQVAGAVYAIFNNNGQEVERLTTLANGYATSGYLRFGSYYVQEVIAPDGYVLNDTKYPVTITENEQKIEVTGVDERVRGSIRIEKVDSVTGENAQGDATLVGAKYGLYAREAILDPADHSVVYNKDALIAELTINEERQASINDLYLGKYYLREIEPSEGYTLDETEYDVTLAYQGQTTATVTIDQTVKERVKAQAFQIIKVSSNEAGEAENLQGAEFTIKLRSDVERYGSWEAAPIAKNAQGNEAAVLVTDENGQAVSEELPYGEYIVRETKTPDDKYSVADFTVVIDEDSREPQPWRVFNDTTFEAALKLVKLDAESGKTVQLANTTFKIKNLDTNEYVGYWEWFPLPHYVDSWTTTEEGTVYTGELLKAGAYQLEEITAPNGYVWNKEPVKFKVSMNTAYETLPDGETPLITVEMSDVSVKGRIRIEKRGEVLVDFKDGQFIYEERGIEGMTANIIAGEDIADPSNDGSVLIQAGTVVDTVTTDEDGEALSKELPLGTYEIREVRAPDGYVLSDEVKTVKLTYEDQETAIVYSDVQTIADERQKVRVTATKQDADTREYLAGAQISLYANRKVYNYGGVVILQPNDLVATAVTNADGEAVFDIDLPLDLTPEYATDPLTDEDFSIVYEDGIRYEGDLNALWYVQETKAPVGYTSGVTVRYLFDTVYTDPNQAVQAFTFAFQNEKSKVEITKTDITGEKELPGAHLQVLDANGQVIDEWVSGEEGHRIEGLIVGESYQLKETIAPDGYAVTDAITFTVQDTPEIQQVVMKDELTHIQVLKVDEEGDPFAGNELAIVDADGNIIEQWTSTEEAHDVYGLIGGDTYTLKEIAPVKGYRTADPIEFTVPTTNEGFVITMQNEKIRSHIDVLKVDYYDREKALPFAEFTMYADEDCTQVIDVQRGGKDGLARFEDVAYGSTVYIKETDAPVGYRLSDEVVKVTIDEEWISGDHTRVIVYPDMPLP